MDRSLPTQDDRNCRMTKIKPLLWGDSEPYFFLDLIQITLEIIHQQLNQQNRKDNKGQAMQ